MSVQRLSAKSTRRIAREIHLPTITRGWANGGSVMSFATWDHEHGWFDKKTGHWAIEKDDPEHLTSCHAEDGGLLTELEPFDNDGRWPTLVDPTLRKTDPQ